ncbi:MAG: hypothetical protein ACYDG2_06445 [Ruminiclostridium sp.]
MKYVNYQDFMNNLIQKNPLLFWMIVIVISLLLFSSSVKAGESIGRLIYYIKN